MSNIIDLVSDFFDAPFSCLSILPKNLLHVARHIPIFSRPHQCKDQVYARMAFQIMCMRLVLTNTEDFDAFLIW